jgi:hypothetical protein
LRVTISPAVARLSVLDPFADAPVWDIGLVKKRLLLRPDAQHPLGFVRDDPWHEVWSAVERRVLQPCLPVRIVGQQTTFRFTPEDFRGRRVEAPKLLRGGPARTRLALRLRRK